MSHKTYLTAAAQWDRTVALFLEDRKPYRFSHDGCSGGPDGGAWGLGYRRYDETTRRYLDIWDEWELGVFVYPHRLFVPGDLVIIRIGHGALRRQKVWGVSSKGRAVRGLYVQMDTCYHLKRPEYSKTYRPMLPMRAWQALRDAKQEDTRPMGGWVGVYDELVNVGRGPLRFVDHPRDLAGRPPDDAAVRRYAVETLRAGEAATRVRADSPHIFVYPREAR